MRWWRVREEEGGGGGGEGGVTLSVEVLALLKKAELSSELGRFGYGKIIIQVHIYLSRKIRLLYYKLQIFCQYSLRNLLEIFC